MFFMHVQFMLSFDHSVMDWLNSGLKRTFWDTTTGCTVTKCMQTRSSKSAPPSLLMHVCVLRLRNCLNFDLERARARGDTFENEARVKEGGVPRNCVCIGQQ